MFVNPDINEQCIARVDDELETRIQNVDPEIEEKCGGDVPCMVDAVVSGDVEIGMETLEVEERLEEPDVIPEEQETDQVEEDLSPQGTTLDEDDISKEDITTTRSFTKGDPHFKTHGGELYDVSDDNAGTSTSILFLTPPLTLATLYAHCSFMEGAISPCWITQSSRMDLG